MKPSLEQLRAIVRAGIVLVLLALLGGLAWMAEGESRNMITGALINAFGMAIVYYYKKEE